MKKSKSAFLFAFFTFVLLVSVSAISAADMDNDTITYDTVTSDTTQNAIETADNIPDVKLSDNNNLKSINPNSGKLGAEYELEYDDLEAYDYTRNIFYNIKKWSYHYRL